MDQPDIVAAAPASNRAKYLRFVIAFAVSLGADQITKIWARQVLRPVRLMTVVDGFFDLRYSENPGSAFGLFRGVPGARWLLLAIGIGAMFVVGSLLKKSKPELKRVPVWLGLLAGGALGNIVDRVVSGVVTDFVVWKVHQHEWPTFNIADAALVIGVIALFLDGPPKETAASEAAKPGAKRRR